VRATEFEERHPMLLHQMIIAAAFLIYLVGRDDVVWRFIKNNPRSRVLERALFVIATLLVGVAAIICTWARANSAGLVSTRREELSHSTDGRNWQYLGDLLYAIGLASLVPLAGFVILIVGEAVRIFRLRGRRNDLSTAASANLDQATESKCRWLAAAHREAFKWGIFLAMAGFTITLRDRVADVLIGMAYIAGLLLMGWYHLIGPIGRSRSGTST
jgi:hypothetical protein